MGCDGAVKKAETCTHNVRQLWKGQDQKVMAPNAHLALLAHIAHLLIQPLLLIRILLPFLIVLFIIGGQVEEVALKVALHLHPFALILLILGRLILLCSNACVQNLSTGAMQQMCPSQQDQIDSVQVDVSLSAHVGCRPSDDHCSCCWMCFDRDPEHVMLLCWGACCSVYLGFRGWLILLPCAQQLILVFNLVAHILCALALSHALETSKTHIASCAKSAQQHYQYTAVGKYSILLMAKSDSTQ